MKKFEVVLAMLVLMVSAGHAMSLGKLFKKYSIDERFEYISAGRGVMSVITMFTDCSVATDGLMEKITGVKVLKLETDSADQILSTNFISDIDKVVDEGKFDVSLEKKSNTGQTYMYQRIDKKLTSDLLVLAKDEKCVTLVWLKGKASPEKMRRQKEAENEENFEM